MIGSGRSLCTSGAILCLQVEASEDTGGNVLSDVSEKSHNVVYSDLPAVRQVKNFISNICDSEYFRCF